MKRKLERALAVVIAAFMIAACSLGVDASAGAEKESEMSTIYSVGHMVAGEFSELGTLSFDDDNKGTLALNGAGPEHDRLSEAWAGIADLDVLHVRRSEPGVDEDGDEVIELIGVDIERSSDEYPEAVFEYLSWKFGFFGVEVEEAQ